MHDFADDKILFHTSNTVKKKKNIYIYMLVKRDMKHLNNWLIANKIN